MVVPQGLLPGKALPRGNPPRPAHAWKGGSLAAVPLPARQCPNTHHACFCSINKCTPTTLSPPQLQRSGACRKTSSRAWQPPLPRSVPAELPAGHDNKAGSLPNMRTPVVQRFRTFFFIMLALNESLGSVHGLGQDVFSAQPPKPGTPDGVASAAGNARSLPSPGGWSVLCNVYVKTHTQYVCGSAWWGACAAQGPVPHQGHIATTHFVHGAPGRQGADWSRSGFSGKPPSSTPPRPRHVRGLAARHRTLLTGYLTATAWQLAP